jgi:hypothetical protein
VLSLDIARLNALLIRDTDAALVLASEKYSISGFGYVFEVGQPEPCFHLAMDIGLQPSDPSTGEWTHPAGGFDGAEMSPEWYSRYEVLSAYMAEDDECESRLKEVHAFFRSVMVQVRSRWSVRIPKCIFTVNECNDSDEVVYATYTEINRTV